MRWVTLGQATLEEQALLAQLRARLESAAGPASDWVPVRSRLERHVWRVPGQGFAVYVKRQLYRSLRVRFRYCLRPSPVAREARMALKLALLGLAVPEPLLLGEEGRGWRRRQSLLVTREAQGEPAGSALAAGRLHLLDLAALVAELSRLGLFHPDLHLNNLLFGPQGLVLLDLQSVRLGRGQLGRGRLLAMAAKLGVALQAAGHVSGQQWPAALAALGVACGPRDRADLVLAENAIRAREQAARLRRCLRNSSLFAREPWGGGRLFRKRYASREEILAAARAALGRGSRYEGLAGGRFCRVGPGSVQRRLWIEFRRRELQQGTPGPAEALVERGRFWRRSCLVFREGLGPDDLAEGTGDGEASLPEPPAQECRA